MKTESHKILINGIEYGPVGQVTEPAPKIDNMDYVIVRTYSAGAFAGYLKSRDQKEVTLIHARRLWYWDGAASLSELATRGTSKPQNCKFPQEMLSVILTEAIEIISCTEQAQKLIGEVKIWTC